MCCEHLKLYFTYDSQPYRTIDKFTLWIAFKIVFTYDSQLLQRVNGVEAVVVWIAFKLYFTYDSQPIANIPTSARLSKLYFWAFMISTYSDLIDYS
jgi:hypothetical protein